MFKPNKQDIVVYCILYCIKYISFKYIKINEMEKKNNWNDPPLILMLYTVHKPIWILHNLKKWTNVIKL